MDSVQLVARVPRATGAALVLVSIVGIQTWGKQLFGLAGPMGVVTLRLGFAALVLLALFRPELRCTGPALVQPLVLLGGFGIAVVSAGIPYSLDLAALRRLLPRSSGVLRAWSQLPAQQQAS